MAALGVCDGVRALVDAAESAAASEGAGASVCRPGDPRNLPSDEGVGEEEAPPLLPSAGMEGLNYS